MNARRTPPAGTCEICRAVGPHMPEENRRRNLVAVRKIAAKDARMTVPDQEVLDRTQHLA